MNINVIYHVAKKEFIANVKNYWILLVIILLCVMDYAIINFNASFSGFENQGNTSAVIMSLTHLQMYLVPLFALIISYDGMLKEQELGTLSLLLTYPLRSSDIVLGKWLGYSLVISMAVLVSFIVPVYALIQANASTSTIISMVLLSLWLGIIFVSIGLFASTLSSDRSFVIAISIVLWLFFVFLFDLIFVILVVYTNGLVEPEALNVILLFNPIDMFRVMNLLVEFPQNTQQFYGIGNGVLQIGYCITSLIIWTIVPLFCAMKKNFISGKGVKIK